MRQGGEGRGGERLGRRKTGWPKRRPCLRTIGGYITTRRSREERTSEASEERQMLSVFRRILPYLILGAGAERARG